MYTFLSRASLSQFSLLASTFCSLFSLSIFHTPTTLPISFSLRSLLLSHVFPYLFSILHLPLRLFFSFHLPRNIRSLSLSLSHSYSPTSFSACFYLPLTSLSLFPISLHLTLILPIPIWSSFFARVHHISSSTATSSAAAAAASRDGIILEV